MARSPRAANRHPTSMSLSIGALHEGQIKAYRALLGHRFMALRCGRRFGKTDLAKAWIKQGLVQGEACAWFAPQHMQASEVFSDLSRSLAPLVLARSRGAGHIKLLTDGRVDFWSLENPIAGRSRARVCWIVSSESAVIRLPPLIREITRASTRAASGPSTTLRCRW